MPIRAVPLADLISFCDDLLGPEAYRDYGPNGLQVPGPDTVSTVITGVSAHLALFTQARERDADLILTHHGMFWKGDPQAITPALKRRLALLFEANMALAAYHLPLDGHPQIGNNALLADSLGCLSHKPFALAAGVPIGVIGTFPEPGIDPQTLVQRIRVACEGRDPLALLDGPARIRRIGIVSGAAVDYVHDAIAAGCDAFVTGEPAERVAAIAREEQIHVFAAGHHATETRGIRALGDALAEQFGIRHEFVDVPNPI